MGPAERTRFELDPSAPQPMDNGAGASGTLDGCPGASSALISMMERGPESDATSAIEDGAVDPSQIGEAISASGYRGERL